MKDSRDLNKPIAFLSQLSIKARAMKIDDVMIWGGLALMAIPLVMAAMPQISTPPPPVEIKDITVSAQPSEPGLVSVQVRAFVESPRSIPDAKLQFRALQTSGLLTQEQEIPVNIQAGKSTPISVKFELPEQNHKVEVVLFEGGKIGARSSFSISGLTGLKPQTPVRVAKVDASLVSVSGNRTTADLIVRLENSVREPQTNLRMELNAKDRSTGLITDRSSTDVGNLGSRETLSATGRLDLVVGRNYDIDVTILSNRTVVGEGQAQVTLAPAPTSAPDAPKAQISISLPAPSAAPAPSVDLGELVLRTPTPTPKPSPGFEVGLAAIALLVGLWLHRRRYD